MMTPIRKIVACSVLTVAPILAFAHGDQGSWQGHGPGMMNDEQMQQMQQNWSRMDNMMQRIPETSSPQKRQQLMQDHWEAMQDQMEMMHQGMMGPGTRQGGQGMMGGDQNRSMMNNNAQSGEAAAGPAGDQRLQMIQQRMDQMQLMMEQMLKRQQQFDGQ